MGMYEALKLINEVLIHDRKLTRFTTKDLSGVSGLSLKACYNSLDGLMKAGLLVREESRGTDRNGHPNKYVCYRLTLGAEEFIRVHLYEDDEDEELRV